ncbi:hypothetical protein DFJ73DRAFT_795758, partial [Zopfochytrium polystomum]
MASLNPYIMALLKRHPFAFYEGNTSHRARIQTETDRFVEQMLSARPWSELHIGIGFDKTKKLWIRHGMNKLYSLVNKDTDEPMPAVAFFNAILRHHSINAIPHPIPLDVHFSINGDQAYLAVFETFNSAFFHTSS